MSIEADQQPNIAKNWYSKRHLFNENRGFLCREYCFKHPAFLELKLLVSLNWLFLLVSFFNIMIDVKEKSVKKLYLT